MTTQLLSSGWGKTGTLTGSSAWRQWMKQQSSFANSRCFWYLIERHAREEHHHVDDLVHDDGSLEADEEKHAAADIDPVFD